MISRSPSRARLYVLAISHFIVIGTLALSTRAHAQAPDLCIGSGGTADCTGPEVGEYVYFAGSFPSWNPPPGQWSSDSAAAAALLGWAFSAWHACSATLENPFL